MNSAEASVDREVVEPLNEETFVYMCELLKDPVKLMTLLPLEQQQACHEAQQSVVDARNSAPRIEGNLWITD